MYSSTNYSKNIRKRNLGSNYQHETYNHPGLNGYRDNDSTENKFNNGYNYHSKYNYLNPQADLLAKKYGNTQRNSGGVASALNHNQPSTLKDNYKYSAQTYGSQNRDLYQDSRASNPSLQRTNKVEQPGVNFDAFKKPTQTSKFAWEETKDDIRGYSKAKVTSPFSGLRNIGNTCFM